MKDLNLLSRVMGSLGEPVHLTVASSSSPSPQSSSASGSICCNKFNQAFQQMCDTVWKYMYICTMYTSLYWNLSWQCLCWKSITEQKMSVLFSNTNLTYDCEPGLQGFSVIFLLTSTQTVKKTSTNWKDHLFKILVNCIPSYRAAHRFIKFSNIYQVFAWKMISLLSLIPFIEDLRFA